VLRLLDCALLAEHAEGGARRYSMLATVRDYGLNRLDATQEIDGLRERHARWALAAAEQAAAGLGTADEARWATAIEHTVDELRAAHGWLVGHDLEGALRLVMALRPYALWRAHSEIFRWAEVTAAAAAGTRWTLLPGAYLAASTGAWQRGDVAAAAAAASAAGDAARGLDRDARRAALEARADVALVVGDLSEAVTSFTEAYSLARAAGDLLQAVWNLGSAAVARAYSGDIDGALEAATEVCSIAELSGSPSARAFAQYVTGEALASGEDLGAEAHLRQAIELAAVADTSFVAGLAEVTLVASLAGQQDIPTALAHCESAIKAWQRAGAWTPLWVTLRTVIALLLRAGATDDLAVLYGAVVSPRAGSAPFGVDAALMSDVAEQLRRELGEDELRHQAEVGRSMAEERVIQLALDALERAARQLSTV